MSGSGQVKRKLLLLGLEQADWNHLRPLIALGKLRYLAELLSRSIGGPIAVPPPRDRISLWTSLATGKRAHQHGVYGSMQPRENGRGVVRASWSASRAPHLAEILCGQGLHVHQIGWPGASPAPPLDGIVVSQEFASPRSTSSEATTRQAEGRPWRHPPIAAAELAARRLRPGDIDDITLADLLPTHLRVGLPDASLEHACRCILAETATLFRAARFALGITPWDATLCVFPLLRRLADLASEVAPVAPQPLVDALQLGGYEHLDLLIGQLIQQAGPAVDVLLVGVGRQSAFAAIRSDRVAAPWPRDASLLDVTPTALTLQNLPLADDLPGRSWVDSPPGVLPPSTIASWDDAGCRVTTPEEAAGDWPVDPLEQSSSDDDNVQHLLELGYVDPVETAACQEAERLTDLADYHRALCLAEVGRTEEAIASVTRLAEADQTWIAVGNSLAELYLQEGRIEEAEAQLERLVEHGAESAQLYLLHARIALERRDLDEAAQALAVARRMNGRLPGLARTEAYLALRWGDLDAAYSAFQEALRLEPNAAPIEDALAVCCLARAELEEAADHALEAIACDPNYAPAHYHLGRVLIDMQRPDDARTAMTRAVEADKNFAAPYYWLARLVDDPAQQRAFRDRGFAILKNRPEGSAAARKP